MVPSALGPWEDHIENEAHAPPAERAMNLTLATTTQDGCPVVHVEGEVDVFSAPALLAHLVEVLRFGRPEVVVDLERVTFIDSSGLGVLFGALKRARAFDGSLHLVCSHSRIRRLFRATGLPRDFPVHDTVQEALAFRPRTGRDGPPELGATAV
jgi:anti-sigma B factor antagonist